MIIFDKTRKYIISLQEQDFKKYLLIFISIVLLLFGFIIYKYFSRISYLQKELQRIKVARQDAQLILTKHEQVKKQKEIVSDILEKGKNFKLMEFFDQLVEKLKLSNKVSEKKISLDLENSSTQDYAEIRLEILLSNLNMKEVNDLLNEIEENERVYIKNLEITKSNNQPAVDLAITIATLQLKTGITEAE